MINWVLIKPEIGHTEAWLKSAETKHTHHNALASTTLGETMTILDEYSWKLWDTYFDFMISLQTHRECIKW